MLNNTVVVIVYSTYIIQRKILYNYLLMSSLQQCNVSNVM